jgi:glucosamine--fructose-6-phosphate aminotransferase (isomerizing)
MVTREMTQSATYHEITTQTAAWQEALDIVGTQSAALQSLWHSGGYTHVIFTGCGSTYYLSLAAAALFQELTRQPARGVPAGELVLYPQTAYVANGRPLLVAVSRSGQTTETVHAVRDFCVRAPRDVITVTNDGESPLAGLGHVNLAIPSGQEESLAQTRSFASMYVATTALASLLAGRSDLMQAMQRLPAVGQQLLTKYAASAQAWGENLALDRFYFLGSGARYGLACEVNLKMKEMTLTHSEPFHFVEFRHGPIAMACSRRSTACARLPCWRTCAAWAVTR